MQKDVGPPRSGSMSGLEFKYVFGFIVRWVIRDVLLVFVVVVLTSWARPMLNSVLLVPIHRL